MTAKEKLSQIFNSNFNFEFEDVEIIKDGQSLANIHETIYIRQGGPFGGIMVVLNYSYAIDELQQYGAMTNLYQGHWDFFPSWQILSENPLSVIQMENDKIKSIKLTAIDLPNKKDIIMEIVVGNFILRCSHCRYIFDSNGPSLLERKALGNLREVLKQKGSSSEWKNYIHDFFEDWEPISDSDITLSQYYRTLVDFPDNAKREIIRGVIMGWNEHHDTLTLYLSITTLIYLGICDTVGYFFLQQFYNFLCKFGEVCKDDSQICVISLNNSVYTLRFRKEGEVTLYGDSFGIIDFGLSRIGTKPLLFIVPSTSILSKLTGISKDKIFDEELMSGIMSEDIYPLLKNEFAKKHNRLIQSHWDFDFQKEQLSRGIVVIMHSLEYYDANGK